MNPILVIMYIIPITVMILIITFKWHQRFLWCNLFIFPVFFTLLPLLTYGYAEIFGAPVEWFFGSRFGSALIGLYYALPMTIISLITAVICHLLDTVKCLKRFYAIIISLAIIVIWFSYYIFFPYVN